MKHETLYNIDSKSRTRVWELESNGNKFRAISGLKDGKKVTSKWTICKPKNVGKENETSGEDQCLIEVKALYKKKLDKKYYADESKAAGFKFFEPMLAKKWKDRADKVDLSKGVFSQPKLDGYRCSLAYAEALSRGGKSFLTIPHILRTLAPVFEKYPDTRFDGELYNHDYHNDFNTLGSLIKKQKPTAEDLENAKDKIQYWIYDLPSCQGIFSERVNVLRSIFKEFGLDNSLDVQFVKTTLIEDQDDLDDEYADYLAAGYEGQMIRTDDLPYEGNRSNQLLKRKEFFDEEYEVVSVEEGKGNWAGYAKAVYFKLPSGKLTKSGENPRAGISGSQEFCKDLLNGPLPKTVTVRYPNLTPDGIPRFPIAVEFQDEQGRVY